MFNLFKKKSNEIKISTFLEGENIDITKVPDPVFSEKMMGDGVAIFPLKDNGNVYSPCDGEVMVLLPTNHAIGIKLDNGIEMLIHLGLETVNLSGDDIQVLKVVGDRVQKNEVIGKISNNLLNNKKVNMISMLVVTNNNGYKMIKEDCSHVKLGDTILKFVEGE